MKRMLLGMLFSLFSLTLLGQFQFSNVVENVIDGSVTHAHLRHTSCHSWGKARFQDTLSDLYVTTWHEGASRLHYKRTKAENPSSVLDEGTVVIPNSYMVIGAVVLRNPDVSSRNEFCVAVIYNDNTATNGGHIAFYEWGLSGLSLLLNHQFSPGFTYNMSIDAIGLEHYVVVYEVNGQLYSFGGMTPIPNSFGYPLISTPKRLNTNAPGGLGITPDVALTRLPRLSNNPTGIQIYYTYLDAGRENCYVSNFGYDELLTVPGPLSLAPEYTLPQMPFLFTGSTNCLPGIPRNSRFAHSPGPKIDAPDKSDRATWAVIVDQSELYPELQDNLPLLCNPPLRYNKLTQLQITAAYRLNGALPADLVLNDGSLSGTIDMSLNAVQPTNTYLMNSSPAVAFSPNLRQINFAWGKTHEHPLIYDHDYIGVVYDPWANDIILTPAGDGYRIIDEQAEITPYIRSISFSGNNNDNMLHLYTVFTSSYTDTTVFPECVYNKHPQWGKIRTEGYRPLSVLEQFRESQSLIATANPNPFFDQLAIRVPSKFEQDELELVIWDITGREQLRSKGKLAAINGQLSNWARGVKDSKPLFVAQLRSLSQNEQTILKLSKAEN